MESTGPIIKQSHQLLTDAGIAVMSQEGLPLSLPYRVEMLINLYTNALSKTVCRGSDQPTPLSSDLLGQLADGALRALDEVGAPSGPSVPARIRALAEQHKQVVYSLRKEIDELLDGPADPQTLDVSSLRALIEQHGHVYGVGGNYDRTATVDYSDPADVVEAARDLVSRLMAEVATKTIERDEARRERDEAQAQLRASRPAALSLAQARLDVAAETLAMGDKVPAALRDKILTLILL